MKTAASNGEPWNRISCAFTGTRVTRAFAQGAADVANEAIDHAAELMGKTLPEPVDLFVYATQEALLEAVSPNRENIAGEAHSTIGTMFVWLPPGQDPERKAVVVVPRTDPPRLQRGHRKSVSPSAALA